LAVVERGAFRKFGEGRAVCTGAGGMAREGEGIGFVMAVIPIHSYWLV